MRRHVSATVVMLVCLSGPGMAERNGAGAMAERLIGGVACALSPGERMRVAEVIDGDTLKLENGLEVRLVGIQAPKLPLGRPNYPHWPLAKEARTALLDLAAGATVELRYGGLERDRYGRALAHVFTLDEKGAEKAWLQAAMIEKGLARVYSFSDNRACLGRLIAAERSARADGLGIWREAYYAVRKAHDPSLRDEKDLYELIEGRVLSVGRAGRTVYLNFGRRWKSDFTGEIDEAAEGDFAAAGFPVDTLEGKLVRLRGWVEQHDGPMVRISHPEQIEVLDEGDGGD